MKKPLAVRCVAVCVGAAITGQALAADAESTTIGARLFADFSYIDQKSNDVKTDASGVGTDVKRFYIIVNHVFDDIWSANMTTDFNYASGINYATVFVKKAYLQAKVSNALIGRLGAADLPWVPFVEEQYGYRYVEKEIVDRLNFGTSADWGLNANGKLAADAVNYSLSVVNGNGYRNFTRSKTVDVEGRLGYSPIKGLTLAGGFYAGKRGQDKESTSPANTATRFDALVTYVNPTWRVGAEWFTAKDWGAGPGLATVASAPSAAQVIIGTVGEDKADGYSVWASYNLNPSWSLFARADGAKPSKDLHPDLKDRYYNAGLAWHARKNVDLSFVVKHEKVENGIISAGSGAIGSTVNGFNNQIGGSIDGKYTEAGVFALVQF
jgi:hypothetical protein